MKKTPAKALYEHNKPSDLKCQQFLAFLFVLCSYDEISLHNFHKSPVAHGTKLVSIASAKTPRHAGTSKWKYIQLSIQIGLKEDTAAALKLQASAASLRKRANKSSANPEMCEA